MLKNRKYNSYAIEFLKNSDMKALMDEAEQAGNSELSEIYRQLRDQKIQNGYGVGNGLDQSEIIDSENLNISDNLYENFGNVYGEIARDNTSIGNEFDEISNYIGNVADYNERMAESQYKYNEYKAQADADKNITEMYRKFRCSEHLG